jgi:hypothetical protein
VAEKLHRALGPDGIARDPRTEQQLNDTMLAVFGSPAGAEALAYLRSITIEMVGGPEITDAQLRHREGMRYLVGIIEARMRKGKK